MNVKPELWEPADSEPTVFGYPVAGRDAIVETLTEAAERDPILEHAFGVLRTMLSGQAKEWALMKADLAGHCPPRMLPLPPTERWLKNIEHPATAAALLADIFTRVVPEANEPAAPQSNH